MVLGQPTPENIPPQGCQCSMKAQKFDSVSFWKEEGLFDKWFVSFLEKHWGVLDAQLISSI